MNRVNRVSNRELFAMLPFRLLLIVFSISLVALIGLYWFNVLSMFYVWISFVILFVLSVGYLILIRKKLKDVASDVGGDRTQ